MNRLVYILTAMVVNVIVDLPTIESFPSTTQPKTDVNKVIPQQPMGTKVENIESPESSTALKTEKNKDVITIIPSPLIHFLLESVKGSESSILDTGSKDDVTTKVKQQSISSKIQSVESPKSSTSQNDKESSTKLFAQDSSSTSNRMFAPKKRNIPSTGNRGMMTLRQFERAFIGYKRHLQYVRRTQLSKTYDGFKRVNSISRSSPFGTRIVPGRSASLKSGGTLLRYGRSV